MWRIISFIFGFPGTLLSYFIVKEGKNRVYGVDMPRNNQSEFSEASSNETMIDKPTD